MIVARSFGNIFNDVLYLTNMAVIVGHCGSYSSDRNIRSQAERNGRQQKLSDTIHKTFPRHRAAADGKRAGRCETGPPMNI